MKLTFLGTGTSYGVPYIGCDCPVCHSTDPRDNRLRASVLVEAGHGDDTVRILVDTGPDFRQQMLRANVRRLTAVLWTHLHNDHIIGLDDIRPLTDRNGYIPGYADEATMKRLQDVFDYIFIQGRDHGGFPRVTPHTLEAGEEISFGPIQVTPLRIMHGQREIFAYEFREGERRLIYATDCSGIPSETMARMKECDVFIVDALRHTKHPNHFSITQAIEATEKVGPGQAFFTHITHDLPHEETEASLPPGVKIAYDGLVVEI